MLTVVSGEDAGRAGGAPDRSVIDEIVREGARATNCPSAVGGETGDRAAAVQDAGGADTPGLHRMRPPTRGGPVFPPPIGPDLSADQARILDDTFFGSDPFGYFQARVESLIA